MMDNKQLVAYLRENLAAINKPIDDPSNRIVIIHVESRIFQRIAEIVIAAIVEMPCQNIKASMIRVPPSWSENE